MDLQDMWQEAKTRHRITTVRTFQLVVRLSYQL